MPTSVLIAVGLEQSVELFHHRYPREQLEDQMRGVFETNLKRSLSMGQVVIAPNLAELSPADLASN